MWSQTPARGPIATLLRLVPALAVALVWGCAGAPKTDGPARLADSYAFWPPLPDEPRVQFLRSYRFSSDVEPTRGALDELVFGTERQVLPIGKPYGVDMWNGRIYVCDITNPGVVILDLEKQQTRVMSTGGVEPMAQPTDIAIAPDGTKYVADRVRGRIFVFNAQDRHIGTFREEGLAPAGVTVAGEELFVTDFGGKTILVMNRTTGEVLRTVGGPGGGDGEFVGPLGIDVDKGGSLYVTDAIRARIQKFSPGGDIVYTRGQIADSPGNFVRPKHLAVDRDGIIYVVDAAFQNVQMFDDEGGVLMYFGSPGSHPGSMSLPAGIAVYEGPLGRLEPYVHPDFAAERLIVVTNQFSPHKVAVYALGRLKPGKTVQDIAPRAARVESGLQDQRPADATATAGAPLGGGEAPAPERVAQPDGEVREVPPG